VNYGGVGLSGVLPPMAGTGLAVGSAGTAIGSLWLVVVGGTLVTSAFMLWSTANLLVGERAQRRRLQRRRERQA
jgi:hypothetical protein